jgi:putative heme transporter
VSGGRKVSFSSWGLSAADYVLYTLVTGIWNVFSLLGLPVLALLVMATDSRPGAALITAAAVGVVLLATMACGLGLLLHSRAFALRAGRALQRPLVIASRLARRPSPADVAGSLSGFRDRAGALLTARGWRITAATVTSYLTLWLVLLACLRTTGLSQAQVPWQTSLAAFAFIRLLTALPITPGAPPQATDILAGHPAHAPDPGTPPRQDTHSSDQQPSNDGLAGSAPGRSAGPSA